MNTIKITNNNTVRCPKQRKSIIIRECKLCEYAQIVNSFERKVICGKIDNFAVIRKD